MNDSIDAFTKVAPYLTHPLVLIGFVFMLFFGMVNQLIKANILKLSQKDSGIIVLFFLRYGFWLAVLIALLGFGLQFYQSYTDAEIKADTKIAQTTASIEQIVNALTKTHQLDNQAKDEQIKSLTAAVTALSQGKGIIGTESQINAAMNALAQGNTQLAKTLFENRLVLTKINS